MPTSALMALDVGERRIGIALANESVRIAVPFDTILVDGSEISQIREYVSSENVHRIIVGYPRNQSGEATAQTSFVERFAKSLEPLGVPIDFQDESLTSVQAEERLKAQQLPYEKSDIDMVAASIFLQDYLEQGRGRV